MSKAIFKFNGGNGALLCSGCSTILKVGHEYTEEERKASRGEARLPAQYCERCKAKQTMINTCGVFVLDTEDRLLCCHPTNAPYKPGIWSIPKGLPDPGEDHTAAAKRELEEETSIKIDMTSDETLTFWELVPVVYKTGKKTLQPFLLRLNRKGEDMRLSCSSMVNGYRDLPPFPEIDRFEWMTLDRARVALHESQARCIDLIERILKNPEDIKSIVNSHKP